MIGENKMCGASSPKVVAPPPVTPDPIEQDEAVKKVRDDERKKAQKMLGRDSTILTGSSGLSDAAATRRKTLLGA
jgi:hypothetical protein